MQRNGIGENVCWDNCKTGMFGRTHWRTSYVRSPLWFCRQQYLPVHHVCYARRAEIPGPHSGENALAGIQGLCIQTEVLQRHGGTTQIHHKLINKCKSSPTTKQHSTCSLHFKLSDCSTGWATCCSRCAIGIAAYTKLKRALSWSWLWSDSLYDGQCSQWAWSKKTKV